MNNITLLVADDEPIVRTFIKRVIEEERLPVAQVLEACNGREAISLALEHKPDLLLLDIRMPGVDGLQAASTILNQWPHAHIVVVTAYDDFDYARAALRYGVADYLLKPLGQEIVSGLIITASRQCTLPLHVPHEIQPPPNHPVVAGVAEYVATHLDTPLNLEDIAKAVFMSASHCSRQFKKYSGQSLTAYIAERRAEKAKELLETTYLSMTEIAGNVGFSNAAYFTAWFKKITGMPPLQYSKRKK